MLLMVGKGIRGGTCHASQQFANSNQKYVKDYEKNEESLQFKCWDINDLCFANITKASSNNFEWIKDTSEFN